MLKKIFLTVFAAAFVGLQCLDENLSACNNVALLNAYRSGWIDQYIVNKENKTLLHDKDSIQSLLNFLAISYDLTLLNLQISRQSQDILHLAWNVYLDDLNDNNNFNNYLVDLKGKAKELKELISKKKAFKILYNELERFFKSAQDLRFRATVEALYAGIQISTNQLLLNRKKELEAQLLATKDGVNNAIQILNDAAGSYQTLIDGTRLVSAVEGFEFLFKINESQDIGRLIAQSSWAVLKNNIPVFDLYRVVLEETKTVILGYYQSLYSAIKLLGIDDRDLSFDQRLLQTLSGTVSINVIQI